MKREVILTSDGSSTIHLPELNEHYHSKHGAIQEAYHVFIKNGFETKSAFQNLAILEIGFGTGLNCFISYLEAKKSAQHLVYTAIEAYPVPETEIRQLNYTERLKALDEQEIFDKIHSCQWGQIVQISTFFELNKRQELLENIDDRESHDLIYFDAFGARVQPELWTKEIFEKMFRALKKNGVLVTYSAKGSVRRAMQEVGFKVEKLPGPPGKRHMLRAVKH